MTKLEAAHRQFATAVRLFFNEGDPVSVHTLASCAHEIYEVLLGRVDGVRLFDKLKTSLELEKGSGIRKILNRSRNFFKHADRDPDGEIEFDDKQNDLALMAAAHDCIELCGDHCLWEAEAMRLWFTAAHPDGRPGDEVSRDPLAQFGLNSLDAQYPELRGAPRSELKRFGRALFSDGCRVA